VARPRLIERRVDRFQREPVSARIAVNVIVGGTTIVVVLGAVMIWLLDHDEYPHLGRALWWSMQTVATVGYGDVTPEKPSGRIIGVVVMLWGVAFVAITTAVITTSFFARAQRLGAGLDTQRHEQVKDRFDDLAERLDRIEETLSQLSRG
jgi:voltage-gated potassium channel